MAKCKTVWVVESIEQVGELSKILGVYSNKEDAQDVMAEEVYATSLWEFKIDI